MLSGLPDASLALDDRGVAPALEVNGATKSFDGVEVLHGVSLRVPAGAVLSIVGHNGSGKSTLVKLLSGFYPLEPGTGIAVAGKTLELTGHAAAHRAGLRFVHQDLGLVLRLSAMDNLGLGQGFPRTRLRGIDWAECRRVSEQMVRDLGYDLDVTVPVAALTPGGRTAVALARALADSHGGARVIVLDEPTAAMSKAEFRQLATVIEELTARGLAVIYISHHLDEVLELGGEVSVLRDGHLVATRAVAEVTGPELVDLMVGRQLQDLPGVTRLPVSAEAQVLLSVAGLRSGRVRDLDLEVRRCEVVGVTGLDGSGRESVAPALAGLRPRSGTMIVQQTTVPPGKPSAVVVSGMGCTLGDRLTSGLLPRMSAGWNLTISGVERYQRRGLLSSRREQLDADSWLNRLGVLPPRNDHPIAALSGGNQQKVMLGRWLRNSPSVLLLEEPTQGVDVAAQRDIHFQIAAAAEAGAAVLICSSDSAELAAICHRVLVMRHGVVAAELVGDAVTVDRMESTSLWTEAAS